jgi:hypothetical protein
LPAFYRYFVPSCKLRGIHLKINPHGGFPIDAWSVEVFRKLFYGKEPEDNRKAIEEIKREGLRRWGKWSWMAFFYVVQDLENLSRKLDIKLRLE